MRTFLFIAVILSVLVVSFFIFGAYATEHFTGSIKQDQVFEVRADEDAKILGERLEENGIIFSKYTFWWHLVREEKTKKIVAGKYSLNGSLTVPEVVSIITSGKTISRDIKITFPEGWTITKMAERLTANGLPGDEFLRLVQSPKPEWKTKYDFLTDLPKEASLEGYLFPDTYLFAPDATAEIIIDTLLKNFGKKITPELRQVAVTNGHSLFETVTMASIVEAEGKIEKDRAVISDIFWKRLNIGQPLQSDATVNYAVGKTKLQSSYEDIAVDSPYNTYKYRGLPPGPINSPGLVSLRAALYPESSPYYYFLTSLRSGETIFSITFDEHIKNRQLHGL